MVCKFGPRGHRTSRPLTASSGAREILQRIKLAIEVTELSARQQIECVQKAVGHAEQSAGSHADLSGRAVWARVCGRSLVWDCGFESRRGQGCLSLVNAFCCHVEVSATGRSLVQRRPTDSGVLLCVV